MLYSEQIKMMMMMTTTMSYCAVHLIKNHRVANCYFPKDGKDLDYLLL